MPHAVLDKDAERLRQQMKSPDLVFQTKANASKLKALAAMNAGKDARREGVAYGV